MGAAPIHIAVLLVPVKNRRQWCANANANERLPCSRCCMRLVPLWNSNNNPEASASDSIMLPTGSENAVQPQSARTGHRLRHYYERQERRAMARRDGDTDAAPRWNLKEPAHRKWSQSTKWYCGLCRPLAFFKTRPTVQLHNKNLIATIMLITVPVISTIISIDKLSR